MQKIGFTGQCPNGDISSLTNQISLCKEAGIDSLEVSIFETDVIVGKKINLPELKILKDTLLNKEMSYTVHGELSVNLLDAENFNAHKEVLKRDIEVTSEIEATHLITHFGQTTKKKYEDGYYNVFGGKKIMVKKLLNLIKQKIPRLKISYSKYDNKIANYKINPFTYKLRKGQNIKLKKYINVRDGVDKLIKI